MDGKLDIVLWSTLSFRVLLNCGNATFERAVVPLLTPIPSLFGFHGVVADLDDNGYDDVVTVDNDGHLHALANHAGILKEVSLGLPPGFETGYLAPLRLKESRGVHLLAIHSDGRIALLGLRR